MRVFLILSLFLFSCSTMSNRIFSLAGDNAEEKQQEVLIKQKNDLISIRELVDEEKYDEALSDLPEYRKMYPGTPYFQASRLIEADALRGLGQYKDAVEIYESVQIVSLNMNDELWAQARYAATYGYEAIGEKVKALAILIGFEKDGAGLSEDILLAELPARVASLYAEEGREKESKEYLDKSERGLKYLMNKKGLENNRVWFAETLFRMGSVVSPHLTQENFSKVLQAHQRTQGYLLKAMELNTPVWSKRAAEDLIGNYRNYWNFVQATWSQPEDRSEKLGRYKTLHALISESLYRQPGEIELWNDSLRAYFSFANRLEQQLSSELYASTESTLMTEKTSKVPPGVPTALPKKKRVDMKRPDPNM